MTHPEVCDTYGCVQVDGHPGYCIYEGSQIITDQPAPEPQESVSIQQLVRADLVERERLGVQRYGTPLQAHNGRDALVDAYQEALDLACYLRQAIQERAQEARGTNGTVR